MASGHSERFILLDRDGVINEAVRDDYVTNADMLRLLPGAAKAIAALNRRGYKVLVLSNQQCVGKGIITMQELEALSQALREGVEQEGGIITDFFYCPHLADDDCTCRKPKPGLILQAQERYGFNLNETYFIGDSYSDLETAARAGCPSIFVLSGLDARRYEAAEPLPHAPAHIAQDLAEAVAHVLGST